MPLKANHRRLEQANLAGLPAEDAARSEILVLRLRLAQLEESLRAIQSLEVDALYVADDQGGRLFTLDGADRAYRTLIEEMGEGALTLTPGGVVIYTNRRFAEMLGRPLNQVIGSHIYTCFAPEAGQALAKVLALDPIYRRGAEADLLMPAGRRMPTKLSVNRLTIDGLPDALAMIVTDLTLLKRGNAAAQARRTLLRMVESQRRTEDQLRLVLTALPAQLALAVKAVLRGEVNHGPTGVKGAKGDEVERLHRAELATPLTPRRREVLQLVAQGHTSKEIARRLLISVKTVVTHRTELMKQLDIHEIAGLVRYAIRVGLISP